MGILYGASGYLHVLLIIEKKLNETLGSSRKARHHSEVMQKKIKSLALKISEKCVKYTNNRYFINRSSRKGNTTVVTNTNRTESAPYIVSTFDGEFYLGAAYGSVGILYTLMRAVQAVPSLKEDAVFMRAIENTLDKILSVMEVTGCLPDTENDQMYATNFCHGSPGAIPMLTLASQMFPNLMSRLLASAVDAADFAWNQGFSVRCNGLSCGLAGNGYLLHCLYRTFDRLAQQAESADQKHLFHKAAQTWRTRSIAYAVALTNPLIQKEATRAVKHPQKRHNYTEHPFSLMEGLSGNICFLCDLLRDEDVAFPGYEL